MKPSKWLIFPLLFAGLSIPAGAQTKSTVVEEIVARVNNEIITREDLEHARASLEGEVRDACTNCTPEQIRDGSRGEGQGPASRFDRSVPAHAARQG